MPEQLSGFHVYAFNPAQLGIECVEKGLTHSQFQLRIR